NPAGHEFIMKEALRQARDAAKKGEVPIGAVILQKNRAVARAHNLTRTNHDPTAHAEMIVLKRAAKKIKNERLLNAALYVTLEPCAMCAGAIVQARVPVVVYGAKDPKAGACGSALKILPNKKLNHRPVVVGGVLAGESAALLRSFFRRRR